MTNRICQRCNGAGNILIRNPIPPPASVLIVCPKCAGTGEETIK
jgi:DnaJ-class molecular chaperone